MKTLTFSLYPWNLYVLYAALAALAVTACILLKHLLLLGKAAQSMQKSAVHLNHTLDQLNLQVAAINAFLENKPVETERSKHGRKIAAAAVKAHAAYKVYNNTAGKKRLSKVVLSLLKTVPSKKRK